MNFVWYSEIHMTTVTALRRLSIAVLFTSLFLLAAYPVIAQDATSSTKTRREVVKEKAETRKDNMESRIAALREKVATKEAQLKARLDAFKDKKKAQVAERVSTNLNKVNSNRTDAMLKHLTRLSEILSKLEKRVGVTNLAIDEAKTAISDAETVVNAQTEKDYTLTISSETRAKAEATKVREQLHADLKTAHEAVKNAKNKVVAAIQASLGTKEATSSGQ